MGCTGIELCGKKNCLEQERCCYWPTHAVFIPRGSRNTRKKRRQEKESAKSMCETSTHLSLTYKIDGPEVLGKIDVSTTLCNQHNKRCPNGRACEIIGQCMLRHPRVMASKKFTKALRKVKNINEVLQTFEHYMSDLIKIKKPKNKWKRA